MKLGKLTKPIHTELFFNFLVEFALSALSQRHDKDLSFVEHRRIHINILHVSAWDRRLIRFQMAGTYARLLNYELNHHKIEYFNILSRNYVK